MSTETLEQLRYPVGKFEPPASYSSADIEAYIRTISAFPAELKNAVEGLGDEQLDTPYRPEGWTIRQVVHHCADSHMNAFTRFKLALTEASPTIRPYFEARWAELPDSRTLPVENSLVLLGALHARWTVLLQSLSDADRLRKYIHPEYGKEFSLNEAHALYAWHCRHHLAHITELKRRMGW